MLSLSDCETVSKLPMSPLSDLERPILEIGNLQRIVEIVLEKVLDYRRPGLPQAEGFTSLMIPDDDIEALQQAVFAASDAGGNLKRAWRFACDGVRG